MCYTPIGIETKDGRKVNVPCGRCIKCVKRRASGWSFRLVQEDLSAVSAHFITLTYDTNYVPITKSGLLTLKKRDLQLYIKRLRFLEEGSPYKIKYYAVGEYGTKRNRPHYHLILFNVFNDDNIKAAWSLNQIPIGDVHYGNVTGASIGYTLKYISKPSKAGRHPRDDRQKEFALMSKGLGSCYLKPNMIAWHKDDLENRMYCQTVGGVKLSMPRYYKDKIYDEDERAIVASSQIQKISEKLERDIIDRLNNPDRFRSKELAILASFTKMLYDSKQGTSEF